MEKTSVLIVEDSSLVADEISMKLSRNGIGIAGVCATGEEAIEILKTKIPDLIIMDIGLAGALDGISTAQLINQTINIPVIYLTDDTNRTTVDRAKKTFPASYLGKPFNEAELVRAVEIAVSNARGEKGNTINVLPDHVFIKEGDAYIKIPYQEIVCLEADRAYCKIITTSKTHTQSTNMNNILEKISHKDFVRVHRSYVVNITKITELDGNIIRLGNHKVEMSRGMREELLKRENIL